jgi:hypothetical protein
MVFSTAAVPSIVIPLVMDEKKIMLAFSQLRRSTGWHIDTRKVLEPRRM